MRFNDAVWCARRMLIATTILTLTACGGGGGDSGTPSVDPNNPGPALPSNTKIVEKPSSPTNQPAATFRFESNNAQNTYQVRLDNAEFTATSNPYTTGTLNDGDHTLQVRAVDAQNNTDPNPDTYTWTIDTAGPVITLSSAPAARVTATQASFEFSTTETSAIEASLDDAPFSTIVSPHVVSSLALGEHKLTLRAADSLGNQKEIIHAWEIVAAVPSDTTAPDTTITSAPSPRGRETRAIFQFASNEQNVIFEGKLDDTHFTVITSPHEITSLADGEHTFEVRAIDAAANVDTTPAVARWSVDTTPPDTTLTTTTSNVTSTRDATFEFAASEPNSIFFVRIDTGQPTQTNSPLTLQNLSDGAHRIEVAAEDTTGNRDISPAVFNWTVDTSVPVVRVLFPPNHALTDSAQITLVGTATDPGGITSVRLNDNDTGITTGNGFGNWRAQLSLAPGDNSITVVAVDTNGQRSEATTLTIRRSADILTNITAMAYDAINRRLVIVDDKRIMTLNPATGTREVIAGPGIGSGETLDTPRGIAVDGTNNRAWVVDQTRKEIIAIDLTTGARTIVADTTIPPLALDTPYGLAVNLDTQTAYVGDRTQDTLIAVNLQNGARTLVSGPTRGTGPAFGIIEDLLLDIARNRLLATDTLAPDRIMAIDLATGDRSELSGPSRGSGTAFATQGIALDTANSRIIVSDFSSRQLVAVDLISGNRSPLPSGGDTPLFRTPDSVAVDAIANNTIFVSDSFRNTVVEVNTQTGTHRNASDDVSGNGPIFAFVQDIGIIGNDVFALESEPFRIVRHDKTTGNRTVAFDNTGASLVVAETFRLAVDGTNRRLFVTGRRANQTAMSLIAFDLGNNTRRLVRNPLTGLGPDLSDPTASSLLYNTNANRLVAFIPFLFDSANALDMDSVWSINPTNGAGQSIVGANPAIRLSANSTDGVLDLGRGVIYAHDQSTRQILRINITTGATELAADLSTGVPSLANPTELAFDPVADRAYVAEPQDSALFEVQVNGAQSGTRALVSSPARGTGPVGRVYYGLTVDNSVVWFFDTARSALMAVEPVSGDRVIASR